MSKIDVLAARYERHIAVPWQRTLAGAQRVLIVVYPQDAERALRARQEEFAQRTRDAGHGWVEYDCTEAFARWMAADEYREAYFEEPDALAMKLETEFLEAVSEPLRNLLRQKDDQTVVAVTGVASLYGFTRVSQLVGAVESDIRGRLVVFFPGTKDGNNYRLLDARDGWNYLANSITSHSAGVDS